MFSDLRPKFSEYDYLIYGEEMVSKIIPDRPQPVYLEDNSGIRIKATSYYSPSIYFMLNNP